MTSISALSGILTQVEGLMRPALGEQGAVKNAFLAGGEIGINQPLAPAALKSGLSGGDQDKGGEKVTEAVKQINDFFQIVRRTLHFSIHEETGQVVIEVKDAESYELIRQIPPESVLNLAKHLDEFKGLLFAEKA